MKTRLFLPLALAAAIFTAQPVFAQSVTELFQQGNTAQESGNFSTAEQIFRRVISIDPNNAGAYNNLGNALRSQGNLAEAIANHRTAIRLEPNNPIFYNGLAVDLDDQGNTAEAIANYRTAIRLNPEYSDAYHNLGLLFNNQGNLTEAIANFRMAVRLKPNDNTFQNSLRAAEQRLAAGGGSSTAGTSILRESGTLGSNSQVLASDGSLFNIHTFTGRAGQVVEITLTSSEFDTYLALLDGNRQVLGQNDDVREGNTNSFLRVTLPGNGSYTVIVNGLEKTSRGRYDLSVTAP